MTTPAGDFEGDLPTPPDPPPPMPARPTDTDPAVQRAWLEQLAAYAVECAVYADKWGAYAVALDAWIIGERQRMAGSGG